MVATSIDYRFAELKDFHGIEDESPSVGTAGPQKMASGLLCMYPDVVLSDNLMEWTYYSAYSNSIVKLQLLRSNVWAHRLARNLH